MGEELSGCITRCCKCGERFLSPASWLYCSGCRDEMRAVMEADGYLDGGVDCDGEDDDDAMYTLEDKPSPFMFEGVDNRRRSDDPEDDHGLNDEILDRGVRPWLMGSSE